MSETTNTFNLETFLAAPVTPRLAPGAYEVRLVSINPSVKDDHLVLDIEFTGPDGVAYKDILKDITTKEGKRYNFAQELLPKLAEVMGPQPSAAHLLANVAGVKIPVTLEHNGRHNRWKYFERVTVSETPATTAPSKVAKPRKRG